MLKDITIGQFFPGTSVIHKLDSRFKIIISLILLIILFTANNYLGLSVGVAFVAAAYAISKIPFKLLAKSLKPIIPLILITGFLNLFFISGDTVFEWGFIKISRQGIELSIFMVIRIICLIAGMSLLTYTTSPIDLTDAIERLLSPLKKIKFPVHELAMMMTIALRFIPILIEETEKIMNAQKARGAELDSGGILRRAKALIPILVPLFVSAFKSAYELALAMECRCYRGGEGRTRMKQLKSGKKDYLALAVTLLLFALVILFRIVI